MGSSQWGPEAKEGRVRIGRRQDAADKGESCRDEREEEKEGRKTASESRGVSRVLGLAPFSRDRRLRISLLGFLFFAPREIPARQTVRGCTMNYPRPPFPRWKLPTQWQHICRALLRECSYLPDPLARAYHHDYVVQQFRHIAADRRPQRHQNAYRQNQHWKKASQKLSLLRRANEGYSRPLEKILRLSYGRKGKKRRDLLDELLQPSLADHTCVQEWLSQPAHFSDGWEPPEVMVSLLKSQQSAGVAATMTLSGLKQHAPVIPEHNSWGRPLHWRRRTNIRKRWYDDRLTELLPPLPQSEVDLLEGLIAGTVPWTPPKRRTAVGPAPKVQRAFGVEFLTEGPKKGETHRKHVDGRPHVITRRFMVKQWKRISSLIPRMTYDEEAQKHVFKWDSVWNVPKLAFIPITENTGMFDGVDENGKIIRQVK